MKTWLSKNRTAITQAFFVALAAPVTLALTALGIYFANIMELPGNPGSVCAAVSLQAFVSVLLLFGFQLPFLGWKIFPWIAVTLFTFGFLVWFQANVFNWDFGPLDGRVIPWKSYRLLGIFELFVYGVIFIIAFRFKNKLLEHVVAISCILILMQVIPVSLTVLKTLSQDPALQAEHTEEQPEHNIFLSSWTQYFITFDDLFEFSQEENVVLIILDEMATRIFEDIQKEHPEEIASILRDFTYFSNVMCDKPGTKFNIPQILAGCSSEELPDNSFNAVFQHKLFNRNKTLLKTLSENQYRCDVFSWYPATIYYDSRWIHNILFDEQQGHITDTSELTVLALFRSAPTLLKRRVIKSNTLRDFFDFTSRLDTSHRPITLKMPSDSEVNTWINESSRDSMADRKTFKFVHLQGAHTPYTMDENCEIISRSGKKNGAKQQAFGSFRIAGNILKLMKEIGVYDQALIIIMGDHGIKRAPSEYLPVVLQEPSLNQRPSFFIKRKHTQQSQMAYNDNPLHISDTPSIILSELGILKGDDVFSPFEMPESLVKERKSKWERIWSETK